MHPAVYKVLGTYSLNLYSGILRVRPSMFVDFPSNIRTRELVRFYDKNEND